MPRITPFLWFDTDAEQAATFYTSIFPNSRTVSISRYGEGMPMPAGTAMTVKMILDGSEVIALNGGPMFKFNEAVSFVVNCETQEEIDYYWSRLGDGGREVQCGWLKDRFGFSWQVVPNCLGELVSSAEPGKSQRVMSALMRMVKLDIKTLREA
jgi:predicted 3-demethylubiquinone-9 3-methyltransferase (glyoxalase superfamily)